MKVLQKMYFSFKEKSMTCEREKMRLRVVPTWVCHCHSPFQQWAVLIWKDKLTVDLCASVKIQKYQQKHAVTQTSEKSKHIPECSSSVFSDCITTESQNISCWKGPIYLNSVFFTQYTENIEENYKEIIYLESELYCSNYSERLHLKN